jgi:hypothetical protein
MRKKVALSVMMDLLPLKAQKDVFLVSLVKFVHLSQPKEYLLEGYHKMISKKENYKPLIQYVQLVFIVH